MSYARVESWADTGSGGVKVKSPPIKRRAAVSREY